MTRTYPLKSIRPEYRKSTPVDRSATTAAKARYAEELSEVETTVSRAALLMRPAPKSDV